MEVCVDNIESAINAAEGGAARIELCSSLLEGGLTPSLGIFKTIKRLIAIPVFVMLRPRGAMDFVYSEDEMAAVKCDARLFKEAGADGFVFGALTSSGQVDAQRCAQILEITRPLPTTFHRAFDCVERPLESLRVIAALGFARILSSGREKRAIDGHRLLRQLIEQAEADADRRVIIVPGAGVDENNAADLVRKTGASELHGSVRKPQQRRSNVNAHAFPDTDTRYDLLVTDTNAVRKIVAILNTSTRTSKCDDS